MLKKIKHYLKRLLKGEATLIDIYYYFQGHIRESIYTSAYPKIIRKHIREQLEWRLNRIKLNSPECFYGAQCKHCGCDIPALTFSDKQCHGNCYPPMLSKKKWKEYKRKQFKEIYNNKI